jgi:hypothetical protein
MEEAMQLSNQYAPEHLILQVDEAEKVAEMVENAGSVFIGEWTPESVGDYSAGVNHSLRKLHLHTSSKSPANIDQQRMDTPSNIRALIWRLMLSTLLAPILLGKDLKMLDLL